MIDTNNRTIPLQIDTEKVQEALLHAVLNSVIGESIIKVAQDNLKHLCSWNGAITTAMNEIVRKVVLDYMIQEYTDKIRTQVRQYLTNERIKEIVERLCDKMLKAI